MPEVFLSPTNLDACPSEAHTKPELWISSSDRQRLADMYETFLRTRTPSFTEVTTIGYGAISEFGERNAESAQALAVLIVAGVETNTGGMLESLLDLLKETHRFNEDDFLTLKTVITDIQILLCELDNFDTVLPADMKQAVIEYIDTIMRTFMRSDSEAEFDKSPVFRGLMAYAAGVTMHTPHASQTFFNYLIA